MSDISIITGILLKHKRQIDLLFTYVENDNSKYSNFLLSDEDVLNEKFSEFIDNVQKKEMIDAFDTIIKTFYECYILHKGAYMTGKKFITAWSIRTFPGILLGKKMEDITKEKERIYQYDAKVEYQYPVDVYVCVEEMLSNLRNIVNASPETLSDTMIQKFIESFRIYCVGINYFLLRDKHDKIYYMINDYIDSCKTLHQISTTDEQTSEQKLLCSAQIGHTKDKIFENIKKLGSKVNREDLEQLAIASVQNSKEMENTQHRLLVDDIRSNNCILIGNVIGDIKKNLIALGGDRINTKYNIDEILDPKFIADSIKFSEVQWNGTKSHVFGINDVKKYGDYLINIINELQAPVKVAKRAQLISWLQVAGLLIICFAVIAAITYF